MPAPGRVFQLGRLTLHDGQAVFQPASNLAFEAAAGDVVQIAVAYRSGESPAPHEEADVSLQVDLDGLKPGATQVRLEQQALPRADAWGLLQYPVRLSHRGRLAGTFRLEAQYRIDGGMGATRSSFARAGAFTVDVT